MTPEPAPSASLARLLGLLLLPALAGCSLLSPAGGPAGPDDAFETGLVRLEAQRHEEAAASLAAVARTCGTRPLGQQAALALALVELDPRHRDGDPERAARLALHLLERPDRAPWTGRMAEMIYLLAVDRRVATDSLGAAPVTELYPAEADPGAGEPSAGEPPVADCGARLTAAAPDSAARPRLPGAPAALRHARLRARLEQLEAEVDRLRSLLEPPDEPR